MAVRAFYRADINCVVIINQLRGLAIWTGHRVTQTFRALIAATAEATSRSEAGNSTNNPLPNATGLLWETEDRVWRQHVCSTEPRAHLQAVTLQKGVTSPQRLKGEKMVQRMKTGVAVDNVGVTLLPSSSSLPVR